MLLRDALGRRKNEGPRPVCRGPSQEELVESDSRRWLFLGFARRRFQSADAGQGSGEEEKNPAVELPQPVSVVLSPAQRHFVEGLLLCFAQERLGFD